MNENKIITFERMHWLLTAVKKKEVEDGMTK
jgi:hypothetical protein